MKKSLTTLFILFILCVTATSLAAQKQQSVAKKDSLRRVIPTLEWEERKHAYFELSVLYFCENKDLETMDSLLAVYDQWDIEAVANNDSVSRCQIKANILGAYRNINAFDKVLELAPEYLAFIEQYKVWKFYYSPTYTTYAYVLMKSGQAEKSVEVAKEMYEHAKAMDNDEGIVCTFYQMSMAYHNTARTAEAEEALRHAIDMIKRMDEVPQISVSCYYQLCNLLNQQKRYQEALQAAGEFEKMIEKLQSQNVSPLAITFWTNLWQIYSTIYFTMGDYDMSEKYMSKVEAVGFESPVAQKNMYRHRARMLDSSKQYEKALEYAEKAYEIPPYWEYITGNILWIKTSIFMNMGRYDDAKACMMEMTSINDSLHNVTFNKQLDELRVIHQVDTLIAEKDLHQKQLLYMITGCLILLFTLGIWIYYTRRLQKKNINLVKQILEQNKLFDELKANASELDRLRKIVRETEADANTTGQEEDEMFSHLETYMSEQQPYTNPALNRKMLADALGTNEKYLRDTIKNNAGATVNDYITHYRLKHANRLLVHQDYIIDAVAEDSGFTSRSMFYEYYRSNYGLTPTEFRKIILNTDKSGVIAT